MMFHKTNKIFLVKSFAFEWTKVNGMYRFQKLLFQYCQQELSACWHQDWEKWPKRTIISQKNHFLVKGLVSVVPNYVPKANNLSNL